MSPKSRHSTYGSRRYRPGYSKAAGKLGRVIVALGLCIQSTIACSADPTAERGGKPTDVVRYSDFGARGDGKTDDINAIAKAHEFANQRGLPVKADSDATYYVGGQDKTAVIQTGTDFGSAKFIIDDTDVRNRRANIFLVQSNLKSFPPAADLSLPV